MNRKQTVDSESTSSTPTTRRPAMVVVNAPTLIEGVFELFRIVRAIDRTYDPGLTLPDDVERVPAFSSELAGRGFRLQGGRPLCGITVTRGSKADPYLVSAYPDPDVEVGDVATEYLR